MTVTISPSVPCSAAATAAVTRSWSASLTWLILVRVMLSSPYQPPDAPPPPKLPPPPEKPPKPPPPHDEPPAPPQPLSLQMLIGGAPHGRCRRCRLPRRPKLDRIGRMKKKKTMKPTTTSPPNTPSSARSRSCASEIGRAHV